MVSGFWGRVGEEIKPPTAIGLFHRVTTRWSGRSPHAWRVCPSPLELLQMQKTTDRGEFNDQQAVVRNCWLVLIG